MPELRRSYAMSHLPYTYKMEGGFLIPFVLGVDDATGDNISEKKAFSEARGHYWLWKNVEFDDDEFVAINQYRRCFWFPQLMKPGGPYDKQVSHLNRNPDQWILLSNGKDYIDYVHYVEEADKSPLNKWLRGVDIVVNRPSHLPRPIGQAYGHDHRSVDWEIFSFVCQKHGLEDWKHQWLTGHLMFIMRPQIFREYMEIWWEVMSEVDRLVQHEDDPYQHRKIGYLTERFVSTWLLKLRAEKPWLNIQTLPIVEGWGVM